ncbi:TlpA family protein disulfide reductase [Azoarcus olearius]|uniref:Thiol:disulphide oxidoreductase n=1 Tax=Azoarcus sp. (strain BH72) TaxID=418699 RepID=A1K1L5_AZOSB|nr:TlpA disulfide reductase family protein [Azoarcus olearius]CAL92720.1 putative thiol:disulphide oxidoreductase [Azoarcus olearius]
MTSRRLLRRFFCALAVCLAPASAFAVDLEPLATLPPAPAALQAELARVQGRAVLINFWASWCEPCRDEMPALVELDEQEPGIALITVAVADRAADSRRFLDDYLLDNVVLINDPEQLIARAWGARLLPTTIMLDAAHRPRFRVRGEADWRAPELRARLRALTASESTPIPKGKTP